MNYQKYKKVSVYLLLILLINTALNLQFSIPQAAAKTPEFINVYIKDIENNKLTIGWSANMMAKTWLKIENKKHTWSKTISYNHYSQSGNIKTELPYENSIYYYWLIAETKDGHRTKSLKQNFKTGDFFNEYYEEYKFIVYPKTLYANNKMAIIVWQVNEGGTTYINVSKNKNLKPLLPVKLETDTKTHWAKATINNLKPNTTYYYQVTTKNHNQNILKSSVLKFTTKKFPDNARLTLSKPQTKNITNDSLDFIFKTNRPAICELKYNKPGKASKIIKESGWGSIDHKFHITKQNPGDTFSFKINCQDILNKRLKSKNIKYSTNAPIVLGYQIGPKYFYGQPYKLVKTANNPTVYILVKGQKHAISSLQDFELYGFDWSEVETMDKIALEKYPNVKLAKSPNNKTIYRLYKEINRKKALLSENAFYSYPENRQVDIVTLGDFELKNIPDVVLAKEKNKNTVYFLDKNFKRPVKNMETLRKYNLLKEPIITLTAEDLATYRTEYLLQ